MNNFVSLSCRIYSRLLTLYPDDLRRGYGADMEQVFAEDLETAWRRGRIIGAVRVWRCALAEWAFIALPGCTERSEVRVPAITLAAFLVMMGAVMVPPELHAVHAALLMPFFSMPVLTVVSTWMCGGSDVIALGLPCSKFAI